VPISEGESKAMMNTESRSPVAEQAEAKDTTKTLTKKKKQSQRVARNVNDLHDESLTFGDRMADRLADMAGSWTFIGTFLGIVAIWIVINSIEMLAKPWDPYPFILLNLVLSLLAGLQAPVIMMSQNRQEAKDRIRAQHDYEVNLKAETEIEGLHLKMDYLRETQWKELVEMQHRQIELLETQLEILTKEKSERR
jgi:uncharacterized membrane protein